MTKNQTDHDKKRDASFRDTLARAAERAVHPSTLKPRERAALAHDPLLKAELARLYAANNGTRVWERLTSDARARQLEASRGAAAAQAPAPLFKPVLTVGGSSGSGGGGGGVGRSGIRSGSCVTGGFAAGGLAASGFVTNRAGGRAIPCGDTDAAAERERQQQQARQQALAQANSPLRSLRMLRKSPIDFWAAARPRARTTNQTMRVLGLYEEDAFAATGAALPGHRATEAAPGAFVPDVPPLAAAGGAR